MKYFQPIKISNNEQKLKQNMFVIHVLRDTHKACIGTCYETETKFYLKLQNF